MVLMMHQQPALVTLTVLIAIGAWGCGIREGVPYRRVAVPSADIDRWLQRDHAFSDSADFTLTRHLAAEMLRGDLYVLIDRIGECDAITRWYETLNREIARLADPLEQSFRALRAVRLFDSNDTRCYSYTVEHAVPLPNPAVWRNRLWTSVPHRVSIIHAMRDARLLQRER